MNSINLNFFLYIWSPFFIQTHSNHSVKCHNELQNCLIFFPQPFCRHVIRHQHKFMHFLQRQIRLCSSRIAQPLESVDFDENNIKVIDIPSSALQTQSQPIQHEPDTGHIFTVCNDFFLFFMSFELN